MRIARFSAGSTAAYGIVDGAGATVTPIIGTPFGAREAAGDPVPLASVRLLSPVAPSKVVGWGFNYPADYNPRKLGAYPPLFIKPSTSVIGPDCPVRMPRLASAVIHEVELAVVIGRECRDVAERDAADVIVGYTVANDITATELFDEAGGQWTMAKAFDSFCPLGPWIETDLDPGNLKVSMELDGVEQFSRSTAEMISPVAKLVSLASEVMTLLPGDVVITGAPAVGEVEPGQEMAAVIEGIGTLVNRLVATEHNILTKAPPAS